MKILEVMAQFVLLVAAGWIVGRSGAAGGNGRQAITSLVLNLILPCSIVISFANARPSGDSVGEFIGVALGSVGYTCLTFFLNKWLYRRYAEDEQPSLKYATMIPNCAFVGMPWCESVYGATGMMLASVYQIPERIAVWVLAPMYFEGKGQKLSQALRRLVKNPCVIAVALGLALMISGLRLPTIVATPIQKLGNCSTPLSMLMIGMLMSEEKLTRSWNRKVLYFCALRLLLIPAVTLAIAFPLTAAGLLTPMACSVVVIMAALPGGTVAVLLATKHKKNELFAGQCCVLSTLLSCLTLPMWNAILEALVRAA